MLNCKIYQLIKFVDFSQPLSVLHNTILFFYNIQLGLHISGTQRVCTNKLMEYFLIWCPLIVVKIAINFTHLLFRNI